MVAIVVAKKRFSICATKGHYVIIKESELIVSHMCKPCYFNMANQQQVFEVVKTKVSII